MTGGPGTTDPTGDSLDALFTALANPHRLALLHVLKAELEREAPANARGMRTDTLARLVGLSLARTSKHLSVLRSVDLVQSEGAGRSARHRLNADRFAVVEGWLSPFIALFNF